MTLSSKKQKNMPLPAAAIPPLISGSAQVLGAGVNALNVGRQNKKSREWANQQYEKQKLDNIAFWQMQNEYNSPQMQMARLKKAGLNPNLVYGGSANSGQAQQIKTPDIQPVQHRTPEFGTAISNIGQIADYGIKQAQTDNLKASTTATLNKAALDSVKTARGKFDLKQASRLADISAEAVAEQLRGQQINNQFQLDENERRAAMNASNLEEAAERVLKLKAGTSNINTHTRSILKDIRLKQMEIDMAKFGIHKNDPLWIQILGRAVNKAMRIPSDARFEFEMGGEAFEKGKQHSKNFQKWLKNN